MIRAAEALFKPFNRGATLAPLFFIEDGFSNATAPRLVDAQNSLNALFFGDFELSRD